MVKERKQEIEQEERNEGWRKERSKERKHAR